MRSFITLVILLFSCSAYAQYERIITYPNGKPEYIISFENDVVQRTVCLSTNGDTLYSWDIPKAVFHDYPVTGDYLTANEYKDFKQQLFAKHNIKSGDTGTAELVELTPPAPTVSEWKMMHDHFFKSCNKYTLYIHQGDFTISMQYQNKVPHGWFKKYYRGLLVVNGTYRNGKKYGYWTYRPYPYYPYDDIEITNLFGKDFSVLYCLLPAIILIVFLLVAGRMAVKTDHYHIFFYLLALAASVALFFRLYLSYNRENIWVKEVLPAIWFVLWHAMLLLSVINLFFSRRTKPPVIVNMIGLLAGLAFSIFVLFFKHLNF